VSGWKKFAGAKLSLLVEQKENLKADFHNLSVLSRGERSPRSTSQEQRKGAQGALAHGRLQVATGPQINLDSAMVPSGEGPPYRLSELVRLQKFAQRITSTLNLEEIADRVVEEVSSSLGCVEINLYLHEPLESELVLSAVRGCTLHAKGHRFKVGPQSLHQGMSGHVAMTRKMHYAPDVSRDPYYFPCEPTIRSEVAIPLEVDGEFVGVFTASHHEIDGFCETELRLLNGLCSHIAVAVHNARRFRDEYHARERMSREAEEARTIQQALLPRAAPLIQGYRVSGLSISAGAVGGDWYDYIPLPDGRWGLVLADVSGKGTAAALLMSATRGMLRSLAQTGSGPAEVLTRLNNMLVEDFPSGRFVTMVYAELDPKTRRLRLANAGHLPPLLVESSGHRWIQTEQGLPLGVAAGKFSETEVKIEPESRLVLYSDGITEAGVDPENDYGRDRMLAQMQLPDATPESLIADVRKFVNGTGLRDDATVILVSGQCAGPTVWER
jgi:sigma-B regulation protein RsbU (phosphoserine phosphatase)